MIDFSTVKEGDLLQNNFENISLVLDTSRCFNAETPFIVIYSFKYKCCTRRGLGEHYWKKKLSEL